VKEARLVMVSSSNNNKFYTMKENEDGSTFSVTYGRVGVTSQTTEYPMYKWSSKYNSKIKKGYVDQTPLFIEEKDEETVTRIISADALVTKFINSLQNYAKASVSFNYTVSAEKVTQKQLEKAQSLLTDLQNILDNINFVEVNGLLLELYAVVPRRMNNVKNYILSSNDITLAKKLVSQEQSNIDVMAGQVMVRETTQKDCPSTETLLETLGLEAFSITEEERDTVKNLMGTEKTRFKNAFRVINANTQKKFTNKIERSDNKKCELLWHGSRNENWWSILNMGLVLRPTNAIITGKMFGYGLYFADKCKKSVGYTSLKGSYWASGGSDNGLMALFDTHLGNPLIIEKHDYWCSSLTEEKLRQRGKYDSLFAKGGYDLINNEYIVYNDEQTTIKYVVEIK
jgi:poly [ADP-ribose] polymerase